ncbi:MAG: nucleoside recognition protein [Spirochaetota bacterium]
MNSPEKIKESFYNRLLGCAYSAISPAIKTAKFLLKIMIPVSLVMTLLKFTGLLETAAALAAPAFQLIGLPGESALVFLTSIFLNIYSAIAVISTLDFTLRELTILALMCLISHNFFIETPVQKKTGSSAIKITLVRLFYSFAGGIMLNYLLPFSQENGSASSSATKTVETLAGALKAWLYNSLFLIVQILILITLLLILQRILEEFHIIGKLTTIFKPLMKIMGLPESVTFLWIVANTLGLAYGSAVMIEQSELGKLSRADADLLNHHIGISHSLLEDTILFAAIGVPVIWIIFPRLFLAMVQVWAMKLRMYVFRSMQVNSKE